MFIKRMGARAREYGNSQLPAQGDTTKKNPERPGEAAGAGFSRSGQPPPPRNSPDRRQRPRHEARAGTGRAGTRTAGPGAPPKPTATGRDVIAPEPV